MLKDKVNIQVLKVDRRLKTGAPNEDIVQNHLT